MKREHTFSGFTLLELLVVLGIMGLLGTIAVTGQRAMVRVMEERGVMENVNSFIRAAYQRAQIDRQPTVVYFWNETLRGRTTEELEVVAGRAVAVRRWGRISRKDGNNLVDEFADLDKAYTLESDEEGVSAGGSNKELLDLYPMDNLSSLVSGGALKRSRVRSQVVSCDDAVQFLGGLAPKTAGQDGTGITIPGYAFVLQDAGGVNWKQGSAYGFEFAQLELPHGYIFGSQFSSSANSPITGAGTLVFESGFNDNSGRNTGGTVGRNTIEVCVLRQQGTTLSAKTVSQSDPPDRRLD